MGDQRKEFKARDEKKKSHFIRATISRRMGRGGTAGSQAGEADFTRERNLGDVVITATIARKDLGMKGTRAGGRSP